jgi:hypothetical protein
MTASHHKAAAALMLLLLMLALARAQQDQSPAAKPSNEEEQQAFGEGFAALASVASKQGARAAKHVYDRGALKKTGLIKPRNSNQTSSHKTKKRRKSDPLEADPRALAAARAAYLDASADDYSLDPWPRNGSSSAGSGRQATTAATKYERREARVADAADAVERATRAADAAARAADAAARAAAAATSLSLD